MRGTMSYFFVSTCGMMRLLLMLASCEAQYVFIRFPSQHRTTEGFPYYCAICSCSYRNGTSELKTNCTRKGLYLPLDKNTTELVLQRTALYRIRPSFFKGLDNLEYLDLSNNRINKVYSGAFQDLGNLKTLRLEGNAFSSLQYTFEPGVFTGLASLTVLTLHRSIQRRITSASMVESITFSDLPALQYLSLDGIYKIEFDDGFKNLTDFKTLVLSGDLSTCEIQYLTNETFYGLQYLENLTVVYCEVKHVYKETFSQMRSLQYLDLSRNPDITMAGLANITYGLTFTNITVLKINSIHNPLRAGSEILRSDMRNFHNLKLTELYMDENGIEYVEMGVFDSLPNTIKLLSLRKNKMFFTFYLSEIVFNQPSLEVIDATDQLIMDRVYPSTRMRQRYKDIANRKRVSRRNERSVFWKKSIALKILKCSGSLSRIAVVNFNGTINNITYIDMSRNFIPILRGHEFVGIPELVYLNLSHNYIEYVLDEGIFRDLEKLEVLDLHNNLLGNVLETSTSLFEELGNLLSLNLSNNRVHQFAEDVFSGLHRLEMLELSENYLSNLEVDISHLNQLRTINLSNNRIHSLSLNTRHMLDRMAATRELLVDLRANDFACNCETIPFLRWLLESPIIFVDPQTYYCSLNNGSIRHLNASAELVRDLEEECRSYLILIVGCSVGSSFLVALILCYSVYRNRWTLRYLYYMAKIKIDGNKGEHMEYDQFQYDIFLSYADPDRAFVIKDMIENLEKAGGLRLCIRDRDFDIGEVVAVNISKAIRTSRKTLLIISKHFLKNKWCNFEMNMARIEAIHMKRKVLAVVFLEEVPANVLPLELIDILREYPNTDLPNEENTKQAFWRTCLNFLKD